MSVFDAFDTDFHFIIKSVEKGKDMKTKKKLLALFLTMTMIVGMLTGCMGQQNLITINADGTCGYTVRAMYEQSTYEEMNANGSISATYLGSGDFTQSTEMINDKTYYVFTRSFSFANTSELITFLTDDATFLNAFTTGSKNPASYEADNFKALFDSATFDSTGFVGQLSEDSAYSTGEASDIGSISKDSLQGYDSINSYYKSLGVIMDVTLTLPSPIVESNGVISGNTVTWDVENIPDSGKLIAATSGNPISGDTTAPTISGVKNNGIYKKATINASDDVAVNRVLINGLRFNTYKFKVSKTGKYTVTATDANNNTTTVKFTIDAKAPKIKGLKSGKISKKGVKVKFSDNTGIKSVKINGKNVNKKQVTLKKAGSYIIKVTDKAGNVTKVRYTIRKY